MDGYIGDETEEGAEVGQKYYGHDTEETELTMELIDHAPAGTEFVAILRNLPYFSRDEEIANELKAKNHISYEKLEVKRVDGKVKIARVVLKNKDSAKQLCGLSGESFLGRALTVSYPDLSLENAAMAPVAPAHAESTKPADTKPVAAQKVEEKKKPEAKKPAAKVEPTKEESKGPKEVPANVTSVWDLSALDQMSIISSGATKSVAYTAPKVKPATVAKKPAKRQQVHAH